jgi:hypothetical protein
MAEWDQAEQDEARLKALLGLLAADARSRRAGLFVPRGSGLALVAQIEVNQQVIDLAEGAWARRRDTLLAGKGVRHGEGLLWPLFKGPEFAALVYLDCAPPDFPRDQDGATGALLVGRLSRMELPSRVRSLLLAGVPARDSLKEAARGQLALLLRRFNGNVAAVARELGVKRSTVYRRADSYGLDTAAFRPRA